MNDPDRTVPYLPATVDEAAIEQPQRIGRYRIERILGQGGFGIVYRAQDEQLQRPVAIKVPHRKLVACPEDAEAYLTEARTGAGLDHPNIVPVFDVGSAEGCPCFVVSKYIDGTDLATRLRQSRLSIHEAVELAATVAEALHHAHKQGLVHRDIKPGNILLDRSGKPFVVDFGLALREQDVGMGPCHVGTPAYMSPEQAQGEGHRVDGRSDIFSLGVVLYELLTGRRPFQADTRQGLLERVTGAEARPPRQADDTIPRELERICLKALAKRASERYTTAQDLADDLRHFLAEASARDKPTVRGRPGNEADLATPAPGSVPTPSSRQALKIVPKGLRSFDASDADFFLELLPGPRDRDGLPESIRFWLHRIESTDAESTFPVGLLYGPSGCGKSSLVKAGLLPRLGKQATAVYVEATGEETEARLLKGLRRQVPDLPGSFGLIESLAALRQGRLLEPGRKVVLVLDQFEQWLHARRNEENTELVQALRQCDGGRVQGLVLVRDDFWLAVSRFMQALEVRVVEGENSRLVDLFDPRHAKRVLTAFGRAFGALPDGQLAKEQAAFLDQVIGGLAEGGKVISVRLALFAEMVKGKPWTPATLKEVGGTEGVGVSFLEETFASSTAPPRHRLHQKAAQAVLKALLPETGSDIKGTMRSQQELLEASGYASRPGDFDDLLRILDSEVRLLTPTDPAGKDDATPPTVRAGAKYCQLTHDYLVPALRDWLTRKQKETRRGRAELLLADRAAVWNARPENRHLPPWWEWARLRLLTSKKDWTEPQRRMMRKAARHWALFGLVTLAFWTLVGLALNEGYGRFQARALERRLLDANTDEVPAIVQDMAPYRRWLDPLLHEALVRAGRDNDPRRQLHTSLALLPVDRSQAEYLYQRLLGAEPHEVPVIRDALAPRKDGLLDPLWAVVEAPDKGKQPQRLRAAAALAKYDPGSEKWATAQEAVGNDLVGVPAVYSSSWVSLLRPVRTRLLPQLSVVYGDRKRRETERSLATDILADYAADQPRVLAELLMGADGEQFAAIYPKFREQGERGLPVLTAEVDRRLPDDARDGAKEKLARRQANAAVALLRLGRPGKVWPLLKHSPDPRGRSYLIHRLAPLGADPGEVINRLEEEPDVTVRRALLLSLGEFGEKQLPPAARQELLPGLRAVYRTAPDPGVHAAAEWLLRAWRQEAWLRQANDQWAKNEAGRQERLQGIRQLLAEAREKTPPQWYVNGRGQTMVVVPGPVEFLMGSPPAEAGRPDVEVRHKQRIGRAFALAAKPVTVEQFRQFHKGYKLSPVYTRTADMPVVGISWYMAASYCNWLSEVEGIAEDQWCYEIKGSVVKLNEQYLRRCGYRLPTEAEMEYATRAGALSSRYYGETDELLPQYAWYLQNSQERTWPVGRLKPNDLGLFDAQGNVCTWCQDGYKVYPEADTASDDREDQLVISSTADRVLRGGSFSYRASNVRSARRFAAVPTSRDDNFGFRPARTMAP
jgi:serine/threonine protein kinase/formylglycine-generating enzyme required for sulfatase activity